MTSSERSSAWRQKQLEERPEEFRKYNADRAKRLYHSNPELAEKQQANFKKNYDSKPEFREKVVRAAALEDIVGRQHSMTINLQSKMDIVRFAPAQMVMPVGACTLIIITRAATVKHELVVNATVGYCAVHATVGWEV